MRYWLMKSEPSTYSIETLLSLPQKTDFWDGVRNYQARNYLRDEIQVGDLAYFYHSSCDIPAVMGMMEVVEAGTPDKTAFDPDSKYYDPKSTPAKPRWFRVKVKALRKFKQPIPLTLLRAQPGLEDMVLLRPGNRLSVLPVSKHEWQIIQNLEKRRENDAR